ncbi:MAG: hypothetical protein GXP40_06685 [Chloroflexi bacterium]|nr:hypothetical protein [Chloroflexota bacterium]
MKRWIVILLGLSVLASGCARFKKGGANPPPAAPTVAPAPTVEQAPVASPTQAPVEPELAPAPDLASMTFVEKNNLYMQLLTEKQAAGVDTNAAEEAYLRSVEASFSGDSAQADQYLQDAILLLWNN